MKFFLVFIISWFSIAYADEVQDRTNSITKNLRCLVCEGQSVYESNSDFAKDIKTFVSKKIKEKNTDEDIYEFLISKYGEEIILNPDFSNKFIFLWIAPILFFLLTLCQTLASNEKEAVTKGTETLDH